MWYPVWILQQSPNTVRAGDESADRELKNMCVWDKGSQTRDRHLRQDILSESSQIVIIINVCFFSSSKKWCRGGSWCMFPCVYTAKCLWLSQLHLPVTTPVAFIGHRTTAACRSISCTDFVFSPRERVQWLLSKEDFCCLWSDRAWFASRPNKSVGCFSSISTKQNKKKKRRRHAASLNLLLPVAHCFNPASTFS